MRRAPRIVISPEDAAELERWIEAPGAPERLVCRARIVLAASRGGTNGAVASRLEVHPDTVARWRGRFALQGLDGIRREASRPGTGRRAPTGLIERIIRTTLEVDAPNGRWTTRSLASSLNVNHMMVYRAWKSRGIAPASRGSEVPVGIGATAESPGSDPDPSSGAERS